MQKKDDPISRQEAIKELEELNVISFYELNEHSREVYHEIKQMLKELPPAQPKSGQWVKHDTYYDCSRCSCIAPCTETADSIIWKLSDFCPDCGARMQNTGRIIRMLPAQPEQQWIPCSKRLPNHDEYIKNNGLFIVSDGNRSYSEWYDIYGKRRFGEPTMSGFRIDYAVDAWMPLPEPYTERREE